MKKFQATRDGAYIGEPKDDRPAAQQIVNDDMDFTKKAFVDSWITQEQLEACTWHIRKVRG